SAPRSPRIMPQVGPITMWVNSTTRTPASGRVRAFTAARLRLLALSADRGLGFQGIQASAWVLFFFVLGRLVRGLGAEAVGIETDINDIRVERVSARHREAQILFDMHERNAGLARRNRDGELVELAHHGFRRCTFVYDRNAQRDFDLAGAA